MFLFCYVYLFFSLRCLIHCHCCYIRACTFVTCFNKDQSTNQSRRLSAKHGPAEQALSRPRVDWERSPRKGGWKRGRKGVEAWEQRRERREERKWKAKEIEKDGRNCKGRKGIKGNWEKTFCYFIPPLDPPLNTKCSLEKLQLWSR